MCRQGRKYAVWVDFFHGDREIGASRKLWGKEEELKLGSRKQLFPARNFCGEGVQRGLPPRLDIRQPTLGVLWLLSVATESNNLASADAMLDLGILRLASRISELKKAGVPIRRDWAKVTNRHGETCNVLRYSLDGSLDVIPDKPGGEE